MCARTQRQSHLIANIAEVKVKSTPKEISKPNRGVINQTKSKNAAKKFENELQQTAAVTLKYF